MDSAITAAIITVCGVFFTAIVTIGIYYFTRRYDYHRLFAETVSKNRMDWINVWRESISEFLAIAEEINYSGCIDRNQGIALKKARNMVLTRLNLNEFEHNCFKKAIWDLSENLFDKNNFNERRDKIIELVQLILKPEWERLKNEARGERE